MKKYKRCQICHKRAIWTDGQKRFWFCGEHSDKWGKYIEGKLPNNASWKTIWENLMQKFLTKEQKYEQNNKI